MKTDFTLDTFSGTSKHANRYLQIPNPDLFASLPLDDDGLDCPDDRAINMIMAFSASYQVESSSNLGKVEKYNN